MTTLPGPAREDELPRIPVPGLDRSCELFLDWCAPLLDDGELAATRRAVDAFRAPESQAWQWQRDLEDYDRRPDVASWLDEFWRDRYLGRRDRIALNANFFFLFPPAEATQAQRTAELVQATVDCHLAIDEGTFELPTARGKPLTSDQLKFLFASIRIPGREIDTSRSPYTDATPGPSPARHAIVFRRGRPYRLDVLDERHRPYSAAALTSTFERLLAEDTAPATHPVGQLTTLARAEWADIRAELVAHGDNAAMVDTLETALFCVCLDDVAPADEIAACDQLLHQADGNRWYDKGLSLIVLADGTAGLNGEHCNLDGSTLVVFLETILDPVRRRQISRPASPDAPPPPNELGVELDDRLAAAVDRAGEQFRAFADATTSTLVTLDDVGAGAAKERKASPDGVVQQAIQLALHRASGSVGATYESIAMRPFRAGRTEAMRVVTPQSVHFVEVMADPASSSEQRGRALRAAIDAHVARARECQAGDAPEQHLWELQLIAERNGDTTPELFTSPGWQILRSDRLSTSSVASPYLQRFGFGSTSDTCIGVGYVLLEDTLRCYLSSPRAVADALDRFATELRTALPDVLDLLETPS